MPHEEIRTFMRKSNSQRFIRLFLCILAMFLLVLLLWVAMAGPITVYRVITRGDTTVYDYRRFPGRDLYPSPQPFHFAAALQDDSIPETIELQDFGEIQLDETLESSRTLAFLVIRNDAIVFERYLHGHSESAISQVFSTSKSVLSILIGAAIQDGLIDSVQDPVTNYVPELAGAGFEEVTIEELLNMRSNLDYFENDNPFGEHVIFNFTDQLQEEILGLRLLQTPDVQFRYKSGDNALLGLVLDRALGEKTITQYMQERFWTPLGMEDRGVWGIDREDGLERTWCCLSMSARDLAKFGRLFLRNGDWKGKQLVPVDWVMTSTTGGAYEAGEWPEDLSHIGNYKYQWWLLSGPDGEYSTLGKDGQYLYVNPRKNLIIVRLGEETGDLPWLQIFQTIASRIQ
jgi:CubicO group peptidase (beta-lactamase class C family)